MTSRFARFACALAVFGFVGCEAEKSSNPTAPTVAGPIPGVNITAPALLEPAQGVKFKENEQPIRLVVQNSTSSGVRPLTYTFEVAADAGFATKVFSRSGVPPGGDGKTSVQLDRLDIGRAYYWRAWAADGANTGAIATAGFEIFPKAAVNPPAAMSPANNETVTTATPTLKVQNASVVGPVGHLEYEFQVATDEAFTRLMAAGIVLQGSGETIFNSSPLAEGTLHFWRVRASDRESTSGWSATRVFRTPAAPKQPTPPSSPAPAGGGGPCSSGNPQKIVECERAKYGHMNSSQTVSFLISTAKSLNANGISGAPFGILRKAGGASCNGYSCDIVCSGNGSGQRQWDVLGDAEGAQTPAWGGPHSLPNIRVDVCEIQ
jgi:hypothetical protein